MRDLSGRHPWRTIWFQPKKTLETIVRINPSYQIWVFSTICGLLFYFNIAQFYSLTMKMGFLGAASLALVVSPFLGYLYLVATSWLIFITGKIVKGEASFLACRAALAWAYAPLLINLVVWICLLVIFQERLFSYFPGIEPLPSGQAYIVFGASLVQVAGAVWSLIIYLQGLVQVQGYSMTRAILNVVIAVLLFLAFIFLLWLLAILLWASLI